MPTELEKAYLAGLMDGEGHIGITIGRQRPNGQWWTHTLIVTISSTHLVTLRWVQTLWPKGCLVVRQQPQQRIPIGNLRWSSAAAVAVLDDVLPYLRIKAAEAAIGIQFSEEINPAAHHARVITEERWERREDLRIAMSKLKRPDVDVPREPFPKLRFQRVCAHCGITFTNVSTSKRMYCSLSCQNKARYAREHSRRLAAP